MVLISGHLLIPCLMNYIGEARHLWPEGLKTKFRSEFRSIERP
jgi:hypothetical protein